MIHNLKLLIKPLLFLFILYGQNNPCEDSRYIKISAKPLDEMSDREYSYFNEIDKECKNYKKSASSNLEVTEDNNSLKKTTNIKSLTSDKISRLYNNNKLTIEVKNKGIGSFGSGVVSGQTWKKWTTYKGFEKISEEKFYSLTGYDDQALKAKNYRKRNINLALGGLGGMVLGLIRLNDSLKYSDKAYEENFYPDRRESYYKKSEAAEIQSLLLFTIGSAASIYGALSLEENLSPLAKATEIADQYNELLLEKINRENVEADID